MSPDAADLRADGLEHERHVAAEHAERLPRDVERVDEHTFVVHGRPAERATALSDMTNIDALDHMRARLKKLGLNRALLRAGVQNGDVVTIGAFSFEYEEE